MKAFIIGWIDMVVVRYDLLEYPIRFWSEIVKINVLFDFFVFPTICIFFTQTSKKSNLSGILLQAFLYTTPMTLLEYYIEIHTDLLQFNNWNIFITFISIYITILIIRVLLSLIRRIALQQERSLSK
jgi:hypothetical protein